MVELGQARCVKAVVVRVGLIGSGVVSQGGRVSVRFGVVSQACWVSVGRSGKDTVRFGSLSCGQFGYGGHGAVRHGQSRLDTAVGVRQRCAGFGELCCGGRGPVRYVWAWRVTAVGERSGLDGFGELGRINGMVRLGF